MIPRLDAYFGSRAAEMIATPPPFSWLVVGLGIVLFGLLWAASMRMSPSKVLCRIVLMSFALRAALGVALYGISYWDLPLLRSLQFGNGFWVFGVDSNLYHRDSVWLAEAWRHGTELPFLNTNAAYCAFVALWYRVLAPHPLIPIMVNAALAAGGALLVYGIGRHLTTEQVAKRSAILVGFWPSTLIWSAQLLRDALSWTLICGTLWLLLTLSPHQASGRPGRGWRSVGLRLLLGCLLVAMTWLRPYVGSAFVLAAFVTFVPASLFACWGGALRRGLQDLGVAALVGVAVIVARVTDPKSLMEPAHPERGHFRLALHAQRRGDLEVARAETEFGLAALHLSRGRFEEAAALYVPHYPRGAAAEGRLSDPAMLARLYFEEANRALKAGQLLPAVSAYEHTLSIDPWPAAIYVNLAVARAFRGEFGAASQRLDEAWSRTQTHEGRAHVTAIREWFRQLERSPVVQPVSPGTLMGQTASVFPWPAPERRKLTMTQRLHDVAEEFHIGWLASHRQAFVNQQPGMLAGGTQSLVDSDVDIVSLDRALGYVPRALLIGLFAPFPWQWFDTQGSTGAMRMVAGVEVCLILFLFPAFLVGAWNLLRRRQLDGILLLVVGLMLAIPLSLAVANIGTLFRLRLLFWLPWLAVVAMGDPVRLVRRRWEQAKRLTRRDTLSPSSAALNVTGS